LSKDEIEKMRQDAEAHAEEDKKNKEFIEARNMADTLIYSTEKALREAGDKVTAEEKKPVEEKIEALKKVKESDNLEDIKKATEELSQAAQVIGQKLYQAAQAASANQPKADEGGPDGQPGTEQAGTEEKPKEAETEEKKDDSNKQ